MSLINTFSSNDFFFENNLFFIKNKSINFLHKNKFNLSYTSLLKNNYSGAKLIKNNYNIFNNINNNLKQTFNPNIFYYFNKFEILIYFYFKPLFFKYIFLKSNNFKLLSLNTFSNLSSYMSSFFFILNHHFLINLTF